MAAATAKNAGCGATYLGSGLSTQDIARAVTSCKAQSVVVGVRSPLGSVGLDLYMAELRQDIPASIPIVVSGACGPELADRLAKHGITVVPTFGRLREALNDACSRALSS
jgi:methylmalonyl-CoA mutase cobalamin-binding subunit